MSHTSSSESTELKILTKYLLSLVSKFSNDTLEYVKLVMHTDKSDFLHNKMRHASMMEKYLKRFKDCMTDMEFIKQLIEESDPKLSHSIEKIYQVSVYDVFDEIERKVNDLTTKPGRLDIQIEFFTTFIRSFLKQVHDQMMTSKQFYFHRLDHKEQRQRIDLILKPLLSQMVHPSMNVGPLAGPIAASSSKPMSSVKVKSSRIVHVDNEKPKQKEEEDNDDEDEDEEDDEDDESIASSVSGVSLASSVTSKKSKKKEKAKPKTQEAVASVKVPSVAKPPIQSATKPPIQSAIVPKPPIQSAVVLPEPIRSAKPIPVPKELKEAKDIETKQETEVKPVPEKPMSVKKAVQSTKKIMTPMKLQSDTIHQTQRQIQSVIQSASKRAERAERQKEKSISSVKAIKSVGVV